MVAAGSDEPSPRPEVTAGTITEPVVRPRTKKPKHVKRTIADLAVIPESSSLDEQNPMNDPAVLNSPVSVDQSSVDVRKKPKRSKIDKSQMRIRTKPDRSRVSLQDEPAVPMESELTPEPSEELAGTEVEGMHEPSDADLEQLERSNAAETVPPVYTLQQLMAMATSGELARVLGQTTINSSEPSPAVQTIHEPPSPEVVDCSEDEPEAEPTIPSNLASRAMGQIPVGVPPPPQGPLGSAAWVAYETKMRMKDRETRLSEELVSALGQPEAVVPCPQWQLNAVGKPHQRRIVPRPEGWPVQSLLHTLSAPDLYTIWHTSRQEGILLSQRTEPSTCPVPGVPGKFIPSGWVTEWNFLYMEYLKERSKHRAIETDSVVDIATFKKWWDQPKRPQSVTRGLLQYTFPEPGEVPQWPTLTQAQIKAAFTRLVQNPEVLDAIRGALEELAEFEEMLRIQWEYFDQLNEMHGLPPVEPRDRRVLLKLPNQPYEPGVQPFQTAKSKKKVDWETTPPALPAQSPAAASTSQPVQNPPSADIVGGVIPGITISTKTPYASALKTPRPALNPGQTMGPPMSREPQRRRTEETLGSVDRRTLEQIYLDSCHDTGTEPVFDIRYTLRLQDQGMNTPQASNEPNPNQHAVPTVEPVNVPNMVPATGTSDDPEIIEPPVADECPSTTPDMEADLLGRNNANISQSRMDAQTKAKATLAVMDVVDPDCPLPVVAGCRFAVSDYLAHGMISFSDKQYVAFEKALVTFVENGEESWENWSFRVREYCRNLKLTPDQSWRMGNSLLPLKLKELVRSYCSKRLFTGFCWSTWSAFVCKATERVNSVTIAKQEMADLKFQKDESISQFIGRFDRIVLKAKARTDGIEAAMTPSTVLTYLNKLFQQPGEHGPHWFTQQWTPRFNVVYASLKRKTQMGCDTSKSGKRYSIEECNEMIDDVISELCDFACETCEANLDATNELANLQTPTAETPRNSGAVGTAMTATRSIRGGRGSRGGRAGGRTVLAVTGGIINDSNAGGSNQDGGSAHGSSQGRGSSRGRSPGRGGQRPQADTTDYSANWVNFPVPPPHLHMTPQGQAMAEHGLCTFEHAAAQKKEKKCAGCGRLFEFCKTVKYCPGVAPDKKGSVAQRSALLWVQRNPERARQQQEERAQRDAGRRGQ